MSVSIGSVTGYLILDDQLSPALRVAEANIKGVSKSLKDMGGSLQEAGTAMLPLSAAVTAAGLAVFKFGKDFETSMTRVMTIGGASREQMEKFKISIAELSPLVGIGPNALAEGLIKVPITALTAAQAMDVLAVSAKASSLGMGETADVGKLLTGILTAYGKQGMTAAHAADVMYATVLQGNLEINELAGSMGRVVGIASQVGVSFEQVGAFMAAFTRLGINADESVTALRGALTTMMQPTKDAADALKQVHMTVQDLRAEVKEKGFAQAMIDLIQTFDGNVDALGAVFGNVRALAGIMGTAGSQGKAYLEVVDNITSSLGSLDAAFKEQSKTIEFAWKRTLAQLETVTLHAFDTFRSQFVSFVQSAQPVLSTMDEMMLAVQKWPKPMQSAAFGFGALVAVAGPALVGIGLALKAGAVGLEGFALAFGALAAALPELASVLGMAAAPLTIIAGLFAGWQVGTAISDVKLFGEEQMSLGESFSFGLDKIMQWTGFLDASDKDIEAAILAQRNLGKAAKDTGAAYEAQGPVWDENAQKMANAAENTNKLGIESLLLEGYWTDMVLTLDDVSEMLTAGNEAIKQTTASTALERIKASGTAGEYERAQIEQTFKAQTDALNQLDPTYKEHYVALRDAANTAISAIGSHWSDYRGKSIEALQEEADAWHRQLYDMETGTLHFSRDVMQEVIDKTHEADDAARGLGNSMVQGMQAAEAATRKAAKATEDAAKAAAEFKAQQAVGGSMLVTSQNFESSVGGLVTSGGWNPNGTGSPYSLSESIQLAKLGYSFQELVLIQQRRANGDTGRIAPPQGPRIPGFAGGVTDFGGGLARVHAGELLVNLPSGTDVVPNGGAAGGGISVTLSPGAVVLNYPIMKDRASMDQLGEVAAAAIVQRLGTKGWRAPFAART